MGLTGTVTVYECTDCGMRWTYRNTPDGARAIAEKNRGHSGAIRPLFDEYVGRHRPDQLDVPETVDVLLARLRTADAVASFSIAARRWIAEHGAGALDQIIWRTSPQTTYDDLVQALDDAGELPEPIEYTHWAAPRPGVPYLVDGRLLPHYQRALPPPTG